MVFKVQIYWLACNGGAMACAELETQVDEPGWFYLIKPELEPRLLR